MKLQGLSFEDGLLPPNLKRLQLHCYFLKGDPAVFGAIAGVDAFCCWLKDVHHPPAAEHEIPAHSFGAALLDYLKAAGDVCLAHRPRKRGAALVMLTHA